MEFMKRKPLLGKSDTETYSKKRINEDGYYFQQKILHFTFCSNSPQLSIVECSA